MWLDLSIKTNNLSMKYLYILLLMTLVGCSYDYDYELDNLSNKQISFKELPDSVKTYIIKNNVADYSNDLLVVNPKERLDYRFVEVVCKYIDVYTLNKYIKSYTTCKYISTRYGGRYVDSYRLVDLKNNLIYRIQLSHTHPYIIFHNRLYIITDRDSIYDASDYYKAKYMEYQLK